MNGALHTQQHVYRLEHSVVDDERTSLLTRFSYIFVHSTSSSSSLSSTIEPIRVFKETLNTGLDGT